MIDFTRLRIKAYQFFSPSRYWFNNTVRFFLWKVLKIRVYSCKITFCTRNFKLFRYVSWSFNLCLIRVTSVPSPEDWTKLTPTWFHSLARLIVFIFIIVIYSESTEACTVILAFIPLSHWITTCLLRVKWLHEIFLPVFDFLFCIYLPVVIDFI